MRRLWKRINDLGIRSKIMLIYAAIGFLPVIGLFSFCYGQMRTLLYRQEEASIEGYLEQAVDTLEGKLAVYDNLSDYLAYSQNIAQIVGVDSQSIYEMYEQISTQLDPMLQSMMYFHKEVMQVTIYSENCAVRHDTSLAALSEVEKEPWYLTAVKSLTPTWYVDAAQKTAVSVRRMPLLDQLGTAGVLYIAVDYDSMFESFRQIPRADCPVVIEDAQGREIYVYDPAADGADDSVVFEKEMEPVHWRVQFYQPKSVFEKTLAPIGTMAVLTAILCALGAAIGFLIVSVSVTKRIRRLTVLMEQVEKGDFEVKVVDDRQDEIGVLTRCFGNMLERIRVLITEVYGSKLAQKEYEMKALQNQINPHFLYNTLSLINWKALEAGEKDISRITLALSTFYRTALNRGNNVLRLSDEISNIRSYLEIQRMMHDDSFDVELEVAEDVMECESLNLILQPLVENAIEHGVDQLTDRRGKIRISGRREDGCVVLWIEDNGPGMEQEKAERILTRDSRGYGVRNVNERIRLYYGDEYAIQVVSKEGIGTRCVVRFPANPFARQK